MSNKRNSRLSKQASSNKRDLKKNKWNDLSKYDSPTIRQEQEQHIIVYVLIKTEYRYERKSLL